MSRRIRTRNGFNIIRVTDYSRFARRRYKQVWLASPSTYESSERSIYYLPTYIHTYILTYFIYPTAFVLSHRTTHDITVLGSSITCVQYTTKQNYNYNYSLLTRYSMPYYTLVALFRGLCKMSGRLSGKTYILNTYTVTPRTVNCEIASV